MKISSVEIKGYEADDIIASLCEQNKSNYEKIIIASPDKDMNQLLLQDNIQIYNPRNKQYVDTEFIEKKFGFHPKHFTKYQAIVGDSADNIKGISGIGHKSAVALIQNCNGDFSSFVDNKKLTRKIELVTSNLDIIYSNMKMVELNRNLSFQYTPPQNYIFDRKETFGAFLKKMEINSKTLWKYGKYCGS